MSPARPTETLAAVRQALVAADTQGYDNAWALPREAYTDTHLLEVEQAALFGHDWVCIGRSDELASVGDAMPFQLCDEPLVAVRGADGRVRVMSNVCRHRGAIVVAEPTRVAHLLCPYHHWSYDLDGALARAPRLDGHHDFDPAACRLPEVASEEWLGFLFVSLAERPEPLAPRLAGLEALVANYHLEQMVTRFVVDEVWQTNWKCFVENFMEGYHLTPLHRTTLHPVNPTRLCSHYPPGEAYFGYHAGFSPDLPRSERGHPDLSAAEVDNCVMFAIPPGLVSGCAGDYSSFICVQPESVDRVRLKMGLQFFGEHWTDDLVDHATALFQQTNAEDRAVLEGITRAYRSKHHRPGPLAPAAFEGPIHDFHRYLARRLVPVLPA